MAFMNEQNNSSAKMAKEVLFAVDSLVQVACNMLREASQYFEDKHASQELEVMTHDLSK